MTTFEDVQKRSLRFIGTSLTELQRHVFTARWDFDMTYKEIAELLGKTETHVRVQLSRISNKMSQDSLIQAKA